MAPRKSTKSPPSTNPTIPAGRLSEREFNEEFSKILSRLSDSEVADVAEAFQRITSLGDMLGGGYSLEKSRQLIDLMADAVSKFRKIEPLLLPGELSATRKSIEKFSSFVREKRLAQAQLMSSRMKFASQLRNEMAYILAPTTREAGPGSRVMAVVLEEKGIVATNPPYRTAFSSPFKWEKFTEYAVDNDIRHLWGLLNIGPSAVLDAAATMSENASDLDRRAMSLSEIGDLISKKVRAGFLLAELQSSDWNMARCSERLRLGGTGNVLRAIRELGLSDEYEKAKAQGLVRVGGRTKKERDGHGSD